MSEPLWKTFVRRLSKLRPRPPLLESRWLNVVRQSAIRAKIKELGPWFHNMNLGPGLWTHPENDGAGADYPAWRWNIIKPLLPEVQGKTCLDVGCSSGFFSLKMKELGAKYVLGIDYGEQVKAIEQANFAAGATGLDVDFRLMSAYDVHQLDRRFDVVIFLGVFYHLRHPLLALESIRKVTNGSLLMQTITTAHETRSYEACPPPTHVHSGLRSPDLNDSSFPSLRFIEGGLDGDASCWFVPSAEAVLAMLRAAGFRPERMIRPTPHEVIVCATCSSD